MNTPATTLVRAEGLDTMFVVTGLAPLALIRAIQAVEPSACPETTFYRVFAAIRNTDGVRQISVVEALDPRADYLLRVDGEKILVRETTAVYGFVPSWSKKAAPMVAIFPMAPAAEPSWIVGDPSLRSLDALEKFIDATPGLGTAFSAALKTAARIARNSR